MRTLFLYPFPSAWSPTFVRFQKFYSGRKKSSFFLSFICICQKFVVPLSRFLWYIIMMSFKEAVAICLTKKYKTISGRATRAEFWWFTLFMYIIFVAIYALMLVMAAYVRQGSDYSPLLAVFLVIMFGIMGIVSILLIVPSVCVGVRRLHDIGRSGWWILLSCAPIARLVILVFALMPSQPTANEYGDNPHEQEYIPFENEKCTEYMKKQTFQGLLTLYSGFVGAVLINGILFRTLHWPGGCSILFVVVPILVALLCLCLAIYVFMHGALNAYVEKGLSVAKHLRNVEGTSTCRRTPTPS